MGTLRDIVDAVASHAAATGMFGRVQSAEPKSAPTTGRSRDMVCAVWPQVVRPALTSGLSSTSVVVELFVRLYIPAMAEPQGEIDPAMLDAVDTLCAAYVADLDLGVAAVRSIDVRGIAGTPLSVAAGFITIDHVTYRVATITLPVIVNDLWPEST